MVDSFETPSQGTAWTVPELGMEFVPVASGSFWMGSDLGDAYGDEQPVHEVRITRDFWIGKYEVTQAEYESLTGNNPSDFKGTRNPVEKVSWNDAVAFCEKLTSRERSAGRLPPGYEYRLPTEAEWEYAARGGSRSRGFTYSGSNDLEDVGWYIVNSGRKPHPVGGKQSNELGIYDMSGNVCEWCLDWYDDNYYRKSPSANPCGPRTGSDRVSRGGSWYDSASDCRAANRDRDPPTNAYYGVGFRVALVPAVQ